MCDAGRTIADGDDLIIYVPLTKQSRVDGKCVGVEKDGVKFDLDGVSTTWLNYFDPPPPSAESACKALKNGGISISKKGHFAVVNVGVVRKAAKKTGQEMELVHEPVNGNCGHVLISGWKVELQDVLASLFRPLLDALDIPGLV